MINIYGAGISGLTIAHILIKNGFKINIYEKNNVAGGMARSVRLDNNVPTEHSWRGYGPFYNNLFKLIKEIPINTKDIFDKKTTSLPIVENIYSIKEISKHNTKNDLWTYYKNNVYNLTDYVKKHPGGNIILRAGGKNLEEVWEKNGVSWHNKNVKVLEYLNKYKIGIIKDNKKIKSINKFASKDSSNPFGSFAPSPSVYDNLNKNRVNFDLLFNKNTNNIIEINKYDYLYLFYLFGKVITSNNRKENYFKIKLKKLLKKNISKNSYHFLVDFLAGPGYGFDKNTMSLGHFGLFIQFSIFNNKKLWQVMNKPTSEAWIEYWVKYLKKLGVKFYFNHTLENIIKLDNIIKYSIISKNNKKIKIKAEQHIICLDPFQSKKVFDKSKMISLSNKYLKLNIINNQIGFCLGLNKKINFKETNMGFVLVDSPYNITFYPQEDHWEKNTDLGLDNKIKSLWSGTIILSYKNGNLTNKSATSLNRKELIEEIIYQFLESKQLIKHIKKYNNNYILKQDDIIFSNIFEDWYDTDNGIKTNNKKWVNNIFNENYRPFNNTKFKNLYIAGSHTKTSINIWSMESAIESGILTSNIILKKYKKKSYPIFKHNSNIFLNIIQFIDDILYTVKLPQLIDSTILLIILIILFLLYKYIYIKLFFYESPRL
jgi:uncharacterized protein with NAD-binding domain and iron-sulfur cluster